MAQAESSSRWRDLGVRSLAALVLAPIVLLCVWWGGLPYLLLLLVTGCGVAWEWCTLVYGRGRENSQMALHGAAVAAALIAAFLGYPVVSLFIAGCCWLVSVLLASRSGSVDFWRLVGVAYVTVPLLALFYLRLEPGFGFLALLWLLTVVWMTDTFAYFAGRLIGGPKLSRFSPKKTWAGLGGGAVGAAIASGAVGVLASLPVIWIPVVLAAIIAVVSQIGDIFESAAKRHFNAKDSSSLIPGHGGILDRIDGLMFAAVFCVGLALLRGGNFQQAGRFLFW
ncbi:MAG: phosphatidate cytidylyltransferase [Pseudomonadota bacterium]